ncbi:MAG: MFS transporter [Asgard group archaeon]|nr:MFS transporter [Asgard group archaeon]
MAHIFPYFLPILCLVIREDIPMNYTQVGILSMTGILVTIPFTIVFGFLGDRIAHLRLELIAGGFLLVFGHTFIIAFAQSYAILILAAVICGIGASIFHPIALPLLSQEFGADRNVAHSFNLIFGTLGSVVTPISSIALSGWLGWRSTSLIFGIFGAIFFPILFILLLKGKKHLNYTLHTNRQLKPKEKQESTRQEEKKGLQAFPFLTLPFIALVLAQILRSGIFRVINTFTSFIFEDRFGASELVSAGITSAVLGLGGVSALISGFFSRKRGSLFTFILSMVGTSIASVFILVFIGVIDMNKVTITIPLLIVAIIFFAFATIGFYFGSPSSNALLAEMLPPEVLSSVYGIINALMTGFSSTIPVIFGAIVDQKFSFPYEYLILIVLSVVPLLLLLYLKSQIGLKTPDQIEEERMFAIPAYENIMKK